MQNLQVRRVTRTLHAGEQLGAALGQIRGARRTVGRCGGGSSGGSVSGRWGPCSRQCGALAFGACLPGVRAFDQPFTLRGGAVQLEQLIELICGRRRARMDTGLWTTGCGQERTLRGAGQPVLCGGRLLLAALDGGGGELLADEHALDEDRMVGEAVSHGRWEVVQQLRDSG